MLNNNFYLYLYLFLAQALSLHACAGTILNIDPASQFSRGVTFVPGPLDHKLFRNRDHKEQVCSDLIQDTRSKLIQHDRLLGLVGQNFTSELFFDYSKQDPLWMLRECNTCALNRVDYPQRRAYFETKIANHIRTHFPNATKTLTIAFFAPGDLLTELMILLRSHCTNVNIVLIDQCWTCEFKEIINSIGPKVSLNICDENKERKKWFAYGIARLAQFVQCMQAYENTQNSVTIYSDVSEYIADCKEHSAVRPDVIIGTDFIEGEEVFDIPALFDYRRLALYALKPGGYSYVCSGPGAFMFGEIIKARNSWRDMLSWRILYTHLMIEGSSLLNGYPCLIEIAQKMTNSDTLVESAEKKMGYSLPVLRDCIASQQQIIRRDFSTHLYVLGGSKDPRMMAGLGLTGGAVSCMAVSWTIYRTFQLIPKAFKVALKILHIRSLSKL